MICRWWWCCCYHYASAMCKVCSPLPLCLSGSRDKVCVWMSPKHTKYMRTTYTGFSLSSFAGQTQEETISYINSRESFLEPVSPSLSCSCLSATNQQRDRDTVHEWRYIILFSERQTKAKHTQTLTRTTHTLVCQGKRWLFQIVSPAPQNQSRQRAERTTTKGTRGHQPGGKEKGKEKKWQRVSGQPRHREQTMHTFHRFIYFSWTAYKAR